ncbi:hypothetical protein M3175_07875 [Robertmurraya korlensis]|uniref:hypothetical protein n=1 Tax=Robertmurraya korlensis TaxID=519977 RepID=UPI00203F5FD8|nr:hypothetical protein [Robertmurraya korlensis]MCM3600645.1 hypothetical protein [Robertmurraya korlensis]
MQQLEIFEFVPPLEWWIEEQIKSTAPGKEVIFNRDDGQTLHVFYNGKAEHLYKGEIEDYSYHSSVISGACYSLEDIIKTVLSWLSYEVRSRRK